MVYGRGGDHNVDLLNACSDRRCQSKPEEAVRNVKRRSGLVVSALEPSNNSEMWDGLLMMRLLAQG